LVVNPKIVLADEPTGNLDWDTADKIMDLFEKINKEGKTVIMATHHKLIVDKLGKKVLTIDGGKITSGGKAAEKTPEPKEKEKDDNNDKKDKIEKEK
jgi:cell division transport system ATP-binding protein